MTIERRTLLAFLLSTALAGGTAMLAPQVAFAKDGGGDGGDDGGGDDGGDDGGGDDGGNDSGDDGGHDNDGGGDDNGKGDDGKDGKDSKGDVDQDDALEAVKSGQIISLEKAFAIVNNKYDAKIIDVKLSKSFGRPVYGLKLRLNTGQIKSVRIDARTGKLVGFFGL